jgi:hypothetical protein
LKGKYIVPRSHTFVSPDWIRAQLNMSFSLSPNISRDSIQVDRAFTIADYFVEKMRFKQEMSHSDVDIA